MPCVRRAAAAAAVLVALHRLATATLAPASIPGPHVAADATMVPHTDVAPSLQCQDGQDAAGRRREASAPTSRPRTLDDAVRAASAAWPMISPGARRPSRRRQNDRVEPLSAGNVPSVYRRLMASRRRVGGAPTDVATAVLVANGPRTGSRVALDAADSSGLRSTKTRLEQKIAKFLNLFTVVQFPNEACEAPAVGLTGTCFHHLQCRSLGGHPGGACAQGYGVCCLFEKTCGATTRHNSTYFVSPPALEVAEAAQSVDGYFTCFLTVEKMHRDVTQLRLDFLHFELAAPTAGSCLEERFVVVSPDRNAPTPPLCGTNTGQHMHVQVGGAARAGGAVRVGVQWRAAGARAERRWVVRLTQLREDGAAPSGCLQYHRGHVGLVRSFGYLGPGAGAYTNNLNYAICIRKEEGFCSVTYSNVAQNGTAMPFQLLNEDQDGAPTIPPGQAGAEVFNCPSDYIVINGIRLCGERLNDASADPDYTHNSPVTDSGSGPFVLPVRSDGSVTGRGFSLSFRQLACSDASP